MRKRKQERSYPPLTRTITRTVRFEEVDQLKYMWHGRYPSWLEDGREELGQHFKISYLDFYAQGVLVPIKTLELDYLQPLRYLGTYQIETSLLWNDAALIEYSYRILDQNGQVMTKALTTQLMLNLDNELLYEHPPFYKTFCLAWQKGTLQ